MKFWEKERMLELLKRGIENIEEIDSDGLWGHREGKRLSYKWVEICTIPSEEDVPDYVLERVRTFMRKELSWLENDFTSALPISRSLGYINEYGEFMLDDGDGSDYEPNEDEITEEDLRYEAHHARKAEARSMVEAELMDFKMKLIKKWCELVFDLCGM